MKVLFTDKYKYTGMTNGYYLFKDTHGDVCMTKQAKLVDRRKNVVIFFLDDDGNEDIQYSYSTARRLGTNTPRMSNL